MATNKLIEWIKKDFLVIVVLLIAILGCLYTINQSITIQKECINTCRMEWCSLQDFTPIDYDDSYPSTFPTTSDHL